MHRRETARRLRPRERSRRKRQLRSPVMRRSLAWLSVPAVSPMPGRALVRCRHSRLFEADCETPMCHVDEDARNEIANALSISTAHVSNRATSSANVSAQRSEVRVKRRGEARDDARAIETDFASGRADEASTRETVPPLRSDRSWEGSPDTKEQRIGEGTSKFRPTRSSARAAAACASTYALNSHRCKEPTTAGVDASKYVIGGAVCVSARRRMREATKSPCERKKTDAHAGGCEARGQQRVVRTGVEIGEHGTTATEDARPTEGLHADARARQ